MTDGIDACYAVLDVTPTAGADEIRTAYFDLVKVWHPDRYLGESARLRGKAEEKLKQINLAYEKLRSGAPVFTTTPAGARRDDIESPPELRPVDFGASWGYVDGEGKLVIEPRFAVAEPFSEGLAVVSEARRYGYGARSFIDGWAEVRFDRKWGKLNRQGEAFFAGQPRELPAEKS